MFEVSMKSMPLIFVFPGFSIGLMLFKRESGSIHKWVGVSMRNALLRFAFTLGITLLILLFNWGLQQVASALMVGVALAIFTYAGGVAIGYVTPKILVYEEPEQPLEQKLIAP